MAQALLPVDTYVLVEESKHRQECRCHIGLATLSGELQNVQFQIEGVNVKVVELRFPGASPERVPLLQAAAKIMVGQEYLRSTAAATIERSIPLVYGKLGFLKAQLGVPLTVILKDDAAQPVVAIEVPVHEGDPYTFADVTWSGAKTIPVADLSQAIDFNPGSPADTTQLGKDIAAVKNLYGSRGYMNAKVRSTATLDADKHTAVFNLDVDEELLYHMGKLELQGLEPERTQLVRKVWELHEGDVYDSSYVAGFLKKHPRELAVLNGWTFRFVQTIHDDTQLVDLTLTFYKFQQQPK